MTFETPDPDGLLERCPLCRQTLAPNLEPFFGELVCPECTAMLWFVKTSAGVRYYPFDQSARVRERVRERIAEQLGISADEVTGNFSKLGSKFGADSLDVVELVMEFEEEFNNLN